MKKYYFSIMCLFIVQINIFAQDKSNDNGNIDFYSRISSMCYSYGLELLNTDEKSDAFKKNLSMDLAALSFEYYFLYVVDAKIDQDIRIEYNMRELLKINESKKSLSDPLGWFDVESVFVRGNLSKYKYKWHDEKNVEAYKKHVIDFNRYLARDFKEIIQKK